MMCSVYELNSMFRNVSGTIRTFFRPINCYLTRKKIEIVKQVSLSIFAPLTPFLSAFLGHIHTPIGL
jgi:hypothetical protein